MATFTEPFSCHYCGKESEDSRRYKYGGRKMYCSPSCKVGAFRRRARLQAIELLGGRCVVCGEDDWRVLQINHINGGGHAERQVHASSRAIYRLILTGKRSYDDLDLRCANCNVRYEYERGRLPTGA